MRAGRLQATVIAVALAVLPGALQMVPTDRGLDRSPLGGAPTPDAAPVAAPATTEIAPPPPVTTASSPVTPAAPDAVPDEVPIVPPGELSGPVAVSAAPPATFAPATTASSDGQVFALVIGIDDYPGYRSDLRYAVSDAVTIDAALERFGVPREHRVILRDGQATRDQVVAAIQGLVGRAGPGSTMVLAYAGHVRKLDRDTEAIVTVEGGLLTDEELGGLLAPATASKSWLLLATCFAGGFTEAMAPGRVLTGAAGANSLAYESSSHRASHLVHHMIREGWLEGRAGPSVQQAFSYADARLASRNPARRPVQIDQAGPVRFDGGSTPGGASAPAPQPAPDSAPPPPPEQAPPPERRCVLGVLLCSRR